MRNPSLFFLAALLAFVLDYCIASAGARLTGVPRSFPPFTLLPLLSGVVGGFLVAALAYAIVRQTSSQPNRTFFFLAIGTLALSFALPIRLSFTKSSRFAGVTPSAQIVLALMHTVVATCAVTALTRTQP